MRVPHYFLLLLGCFLASAQPLDMDMLHNLNVRNVGLRWFLINDNPRFTNNQPFYFQGLAVDPAAPQPAVQYLSALTRKLRGW